MINNTKILTIIDGHNNRKGDEDLLHFDDYYYVYNLELKDGKLFNLGNLLDLAKYKTVIFNFNEDLFTYSRNWDPKLTKRFQSCQEMIEHFQDISKMIKRQLDINIFNDPEIIFTLGNKVKSYNLLKTISDPLFRIPKYREINKPVDLKGVNFFPCILKISNGSSSKQDTICHHRRQLFSVYAQKFRGKKNVFCVQYINSFLKDLGCFHNIRLMVTGDKLLDFYYRPSKGWNIHGYDHNLNKLLIGDRYFSKIINSNAMKIQEYLTKVSELFGLGTFSLDCIFYQGSIYICEIGLKIHCQPYSRIVNKFSGKLSKKSIDKGQLASYYQDFFRNDRFK